MTNDQIDQELENLGYSFRKNIIKTTELRVSRALHLLNTDIINLEMYGETVEDKIKLAALEEKYNKIKGIK